MSSQGRDHEGCKVHFFKVILESNLRDGELRVPRSFVNRYWKGMPNPVFLRLPNNTERKIYWMKRDGDVWFRNGWKEFAEHVSLDVSHFLVFQHEEKSHFNVIIFDKSALEIKYPSPRGTDNEVEAVNDESDCSLEVLDDFSPFEGKRPKSSLPSSQTRKKMKTNPKEEPECYSNHAEIKHEKKKVHAGGFDTDKPKNRGDLKLIEDISKALLERVKKNFRSENHFFACRCQKTYTERDLMIIPKEFSEHLDNKEGNATLFVNRERTWDVRIKFSSYRQLSFRDGWKKFFHDNNLKLGDVCVFVLNKCRRFSFRVVIFPLGEDSSTPLFEEQEGLSHRPSSVSLRNPETPKANSRCISKNEFIFSFKHSTPSHCATIPIDFVRSYIIHNGKYATLRVGKRSWPVKVLYYPHYSSARLSVGWLDFVRDCNLKQGDACRFKVIDEENLVLEVSISRHNH